MLHDHGRPFASAGLAAGIWLLLGVASWAHLSKRSRRRVALFAVVGSMAVGAVALHATQRLRDAYTSTLTAEAEIRSGLEAARSTDFEATEDSIAAASANLLDAERSLSSPSVSAMLRVPVAAQNLQTVVDVLGSAHDVVETGQTLANEAQRLDQVIDEDGIAIDGVERIAAGADEWLAEARALHNILSEDRSVWVVSELDSALNDVATKTAPIGELGDLSLSNAVKGVLGGDGQRSYLVLLGNTAEARELGGFAGGTALLQIDDGQVALERTDRPREFNERPADPTVFTQAPPQRFLEHRPWLFAQNYTAMIDFSTLADALGNIYPNASGNEIDGVAYVDPQALGAVLGLVGEVHLEDADITVDAESVSELVSVVQYERFDEQTQRAEREAFLGELIARTFEELFGAGDDLKLENLPALASAIHQDRLLFVPFEDEEFTLMEAAGLVGELPQQDGHDYLAVSHLNGGPNKLDAYLHRTVDYQAEVDPHTGQLDATVTITLRNDAPQGLSKYAAGNQHDYPLGTNRAFVVVHTPHDAVEWSGGSEHQLTRSWREFGLQRHEQVVIVPRGHSRTVMLQLRGSVNPGDYHIDIGHQPLLHDDALTVSVEPTTGAFVRPASTASENSRDIQAEFNLKHDTALRATWVPASIQPLARSVGGG